MRAETLGGMVIFAEVVEAGSFSEAARRLGMSKSAVSKQVARLEDHLGARLLNRTTRRLSLTDNGTAFHARCVRILAEAEEAEQAVSRLQAVPRGWLRVNAPMSFGHLHLAPLVAGFMQQYPEVQVDLHLNDRVVDLVEEGFDVGVRIGHLSDSTLVARRLADNREVLCASPAYFAAYGRPETPERLREHNVLEYAYRQGGRDLRFRRADGGTYRVPTSGTLRANNGTVLRDAALAGIGIIRIPTFIVGQDLASGALEPLFADELEEDRGIYAIYPHSRHLSAKVRAFVDHLAAGYARPAWEAWIERKGAAG